MSNLAGCGTCCRPLVSFSPGSASDACIGWAILACLILRICGNPVAQACRSSLDNVVTRSAYVAHQVAAGVCNNPLAWYASGSCCH